MAAAALSRQPRARVLASLWFAGILGLVGCSEPAFPRDAEGTLERVISDGVLRVGASENRPWSVVDDDGGVSGTEADILSDYASTLGATVSWSTGAESQLILALAEGDLDVVMGGIRSDSPWSELSALTRPHSGSWGPDGKREDLVFACRLGENALLTNLERFLISEGLEP
ncbi:MAG: transporter substrate-binding domain-containing protein [Propionibacteriaceae bacterium]|nr:transporter substrate-binding domain-containing protein [Propionibacteriaceae bacterium]